MSRDQPTAVQIENIKALIDVQHLSINVAQAKMNEAPTYQHIYGLEVEIRREYLEELEKELKELSDNNSKK